MNEEKEKIAETRSAQTNVALGLFLLCFGVIVMIATYFTGTTAGRITNLSSGIVLAAIGAGMIIAGRRKQRTE